MNVARNDSQLYSYQPPNGNHPTGTTGDWRKRYANTKKPDVKDGSLWLRIPFMWSWIAGKLTHSDSRAVVVSGDRTRQGTGRRKYPQWIYLTKDGIQNGTFKTLNKSIVKANELIFTWIAWKAARGNFFGWGRCSLSDWDVGYTGVHTFVNSYQKCKLIICTFYSNLYLNKKTRTSI